MIVGMRLLTSATRRKLAHIFFLSSLSLLIFPSACLGQVNYVSRFSLEKEEFLLGEPIFCTYSIQNTGTRPFAFSYRLPRRVLNRDLEQEPRFRVTDSTGQSLPDPAPKPCGGAKGSVVYGSVSLPPGQTHTERWLLNEWARFSVSGRYRVRAERRLPLLALDPATGRAAEHAAAFAMAINELTFEVRPATDAELDRVFQPYAKMLDERRDSNLAEAFLVATTLPRPLFLPQLAAMARVPADEPARAGWDRRQALEGLARLGTPAAWESIAKVARGEVFARDAPQPNPGSRGDAALRAYAVLLLGEKADKAFLPVLLDTIASAPEEIRGDVLRSLGFFHDPRANQVLFDKLHAASPADRVNAILGLKNLESKDAVPALLAMLNDPEAQVRQVANFALEGLTGQKTKLSAKASREESARVAERWHAWWREKGGSFAPVHQTLCHDW